MGGAGSGRKPDPVKKFLSESKSPMLSVGGEALIIPNHSGDHSAGRVLRTPVNDTDIVNKAYVDANAGVSDHGALTGLGDDDHTQYFLADGSRALGGNLDIGTSFRTFVNGSSTVFALLDAGSGVNYGIFTNAATGQGVNFAAAGTDTNIDLELTAKGSGKITLQSDNIVNTNKRIYFRDTGISLYSPADGDLDIVCDADLQIYGSTSTTIGVAGDISLGDTTLRAMKPVSTLKMDLGSSSLRFNNLYLGNDIDLDDGADIVLGTTTGSTIATSTSQALGFWGATPIAQPSSTGTTTGFTAGTGTGVNSDSTFTGGTGTKAYTIGDIVKHLKAMGLLASS